MIAVGMSAGECVLIASVKLSLYGTRPSRVTVCYRSTKYLQHYVMASVNALRVSLSANYVTW